MMNTKVDQVTQRRRNVGLIAYDSSVAAGGYTLIAPQTAEGNVYLINSLGDIVHHWKMPVRPGRHAVILPNGNLGYNGNHANSPERYPAWSMWHGGDFYEMTPSGKMVWHYEDIAHHHDALWLPNGHLLYAACEQATKEFSASVIGGTQHENCDSMFLDVIREVNRKGELVWEWKASDHLVPENFPIHPGFGRYHWPLINGLGVMKDGTILISLRTTSGILGVDKSTGKTKFHISRSVVSYQHAPVQLDNGNILIFDNGNFRDGSHVAFSRILEIDVSTGGIVWQYQDKTVNSFYSPFMGNAQRLWNGNTHITESATGRLFEVTPLGEVVWEYIIPWFAEYPDESARRTGPGLVNSVFQTHRYHSSAIPWLKKNK